MSGANPYRFTTLAHATHDFCNPLGAGTLSRFVEALELEPGARVLDVGCGKGELLVRVVARWGARGTGVDLNPTFLDEARARAAAGGAPGAGGGIEWIEGAAATALAGSRTFDLAMCVGSAHALGALPEALAALHRRLAPGGRLLLGHGYWKREPEPEYLAGFGGSRDELGTLEDNRAALAAAGFELLDEAASTEAEWDAYEDRYAANIERHFEAHPADPDREAFLARSRSWHALYRRWGRDTMGFALYRARRPAAEPSRSA